MSTAPGLLRRFLSAGAAARPNGPSEAKRLWSALDAEIRPSFLRPAVDREAEAEAERVARSARPGSAAEALVARGLLPADFDRSGRFVFAPRSPWAERFLGFVPASGGPPDEDTLPALVGRWAAVSAGVALLDEAADRLRPWGWLGAEHRVTLAPRADVASALDTESRLYTPALNELLSGRAVFVRGDLGRGNGASPGNCAQPARTLSAHAAWRVNARRGGVTRRFRDERLPPPRPFAESPDPYEPLVDLMRLGLGCRSCHMRPPGDPSGLLVEDALWLLVPTG